MDLTRAGFLRAAGAGLAAPALTPRVWADAQRPRALVLSGGIAEGVYEAGVAKALLEDGYEFDVICGTSIGALNGSLLAQGEPDHLFRIWSEISRADPPIMKLTSEAQKIHDDVVLLSDQSRGTINRILALCALKKKAGKGGGDLLHIEGIIDPRGAQKVLSVLDLTKVKTPFLFATSNVTRGRAEAFLAPGTSGQNLPTNNAASSVPLNTLRATDPVHRAMYAEAVRASGAFPLAFAPVSLPSFAVSGATDRFLDGGVANNTPIRLARKSGARSAICVFLQPKDDTPQPPADDLGIVLNLYTENQQQLLDDELILANEYNQVAAMAVAARGMRALERAGDPPLPPPVDLFEIRPSVQLSLDANHAAFGFDRQDLLDWDFALGYRDGKRGPQPFRPKQYPFSVRFAPQ
jgi:predicted acylesterase/phospholipase RssA